jgi:hypothetical protein
MPCPGLNLGSSDQYVWYLPDGFEESQRTVCSDCCEANNISGTIKSLGPSNCDSYYYTNFADNGVFNFSVWSEDMHDLHPGDSTGIVMLPTNGFFNILISCYGLKPGQVYTWSIHTKDDQVLESSPENCYYLSTCLTKGVYYVNSPMCLVFKMHIYTLQKIDPFSQQGDYGLVTVTSEGFFNDACTIKVLSGYASTFNNLQMHMRFKKFTVNPVCYTLKLTCDNTHNLKETLQRVKDIEYAKQQVQMKKLTDEIDLLTSKLKELHASSVGAN